MDTEATNSNRKLLKGAVSRQAIRRHPVSDALSQVRMQRTETAALGAGIVIVIASSLITGLIHPIPFPFNFLVSLMLGGMAGFGTLKVLDPRTKNDAADDQMNDEYDSVLTDLSRIAAYLSDASRTPCLSASVSQQIDQIASMTWLIVSRYEQRPRDFASASSILRVLDEFQKLTASYLKMKSGEQFVDPQTRLAEIAEMEGHQLPMIQRALETLGQQLDSGEMVARKVSKGTLEGMLRSLGLIEEFNRSRESTPPKEVSR